MPIDDNPKRGRVELLNNGKWGTVCNSPFYPLNFAQVVCRQLGYPITLAVFTAGRSHPGTGPILLSGVRCDGNEDYIQHCRHHGWDNVRCQHADDAGVECASVFMCVIFLALAGVWVTACVCMCACICTCECVCLR